MLKFLESFFVAQGIQFILLGAFVQGFKK